MYKLFKTEDVVITLEPSLDQTGSDGQILEYLRVECKFRSSSLQDETVVLKVLGLDLAQWEHLLSRGLVLVEGSVDRHCGSLDEAQPDGHVGHFKISTEIETIHNIRDVPDEWDCSW
jgi:hypothetical protein